MDVGKKPIKSRASIHTMSSCCGQQNRKAYGRVPIGPGRSDGEHAVLCDEGVRQTSSGKNHASRTQSAACVEGSVS